MKRVLAGIVAVFCILFGLHVRIDYNRLSPISIESQGECTRIDTVLSVGEVFEALGGEILWTEKLDGVVVYYGYSDYINGYKIVHSRRVNVMVADRAESRAVGIPLLIGSY